MWTLYLDEVGHDGPYDPVHPVAGSSPLFGLVRVKRPGAFDSRAVYGSTVQRILDAFHRFLTRRPDPDHGLVVLDERDRTQNGALLASAQGYIFGRDLHSIVETPFVVDSRWSPGVQISDNLTGVLHSVFRARAGLAAYAPAESSFGRTVDGLTWSDDAATSLRMTS